MPRHVQHCNVNCSDLDRSLTFYRDELGLAPATRTAPEPQDGAGFGIDGPAQWDAWMMSDGRSNPIIDLLEWKVPKPGAPPHTSADALGMIALRIASPSVTTPTEITDPDGTRLQVEPGAAVRFLGVTINVSDLEASDEWYRRVLGLEGPAHELSLPGDDFRISLRRGDPEIPAYASANDLGIFRMAFLVDDAADAVAETRRNGAECPDPVELDMGPTIPIDGLWAVFFRDPDGTCLEYIQATAPR